jgi:hypothetical protein
MPSDCTAFAELGARPTSTVLSLALSAVVALTGCSPEPAPAPPAKADLVGVWCGDPGEEVSLSPDGTFLVEGLSAAFTDELLADDGYVDGYRLRTEFGGVRPTTGAGTWKLYDGPTTLVLSLGFDRLGARVFDHAYSVYMDRDDGDRLLYFSVGDPDSGDQHRFRRCDAD